MKRLLFPVILFSLFHCQPPRAEPVRAEPVRAEPHGYMGTDPEGTFERVFAWLEEPPAAGR